MELMDDSVAFMLSFLETLSTKDMACEADKVNNVMHLSKHSSSPINITKITADNLFYCKMCTNNNEAWYSNY